MVHQARDNKECSHSDGEGVDGYFIWDQPQPMTKAQQEEFTHEYYRIWILAETKDPKARTSYLEMLEPNEHQLLDYLGVGLKWSCIIKPHLGICKDESLNQALSLRPHGQANVQGWNKALKDTKESYYARRLAEAKAALNAVDRRLTEILTIWNEEDQHEAN